MHDPKTGLAPFPLRVRARLRGLWRRWTDDTYGASTVTTAVTLPLLIILVMGIFYLFRVMLVKWSFDRGVRESARYISETAAFWEQRFEDADGSMIDPNDPSVNLGVAPANFYDIEAKRIILSRLHDVFSYDYVYKDITNSLQVTVTEPYLSELVESGQITLTDVISADQGADMDRLCDLASRYKEGLTEYEEWRHHNNIRFRVYATMDLPIAWAPRLPWGGDNYTVTMRFANRAVGYVQCARWDGQREAGSGNKTEKYGREGPALRYRTLSTPWYPTVTPFPTYTPVPTATMPVAPTVTPVTPLPPP